MAEPAADRRLVDVTRPVEPGIPVWPGDPPFELRQRREPDLVLSSFSTTCHVGSHLDAPLHLDETAHGVEGVALHRLVGRAEVIQVALGAAALSPADLPFGWLPTTRRVLVRTDSHPLGAPFDLGFTGLSAELVHVLADGGVELVGVDTPSVDLFSSHDLPAHHALLERGMTWIEGLWLEDAAPGLYDLIALPMLLVGAEAAPVRAVLRPVSKS